MSKKTEWKNINQTNGILSISSRNSVFQKYNYFLFTTVKSLNSTNNFTKIIEWLKL